ncbi:CHAT domain-containing protein [Kitasatospora sp. NPDC048722]|uniref:CHAT domain-containing protein n=1 Tax=Kitasatospora sp. NPDC048722 TaxID=3155639 RepID=UPI0033E7ACD3
MSDEMLAALERRVSGFEETGDRELLRGPEVLREAAEVLHGLPAQEHEERLDRLEVLGRVFRDRQDRSEFSLSDVERPVADLIAALLCEYREPEEDAPPRLGPPVVPPIHWCAVLSGLTAHLARRPLHWDVVVHTVQTVAACTGSAELRRRALALTAALAYDRHRAAKDSPALLLHAVAALRTATDPERHGPDDPGPAAGDLDFRGTVAYFCYTVTDDLSYLEESVRCHAVAFVVLPRDKLALGADNLAASQCELARVRRDADLLWEAFGNFLLSAELSGEGPNGPAVHKAWKVLETGPEVFTTTAELDRAVRAGYRLLARSRRAGPDPEEHEHLSVLGQLVFDQWYVMRLGRDSGVRVERARRRAVRLLRRVRAGTAPGDEQQQAVDGGLAELTTGPRRVIPRGLGRTEREFRAIGALAETFQRHGNALFLELALRRGTDLLPELPAGDPRRAHLLQNLAEILIHRANRTGSTEPVDRALGHLAEARSIHADRPGDLTAVTVAELNLYRLRHELSGAPDDLHRALALAAQVELPGLSAQARNRVGLALRRLYELGHDLSVLRSSERFLLSALADTEDADLADSIRTNLASTQLLFHYRGSDPDRLRSAIGHLRTAVDGIDDRHPYLGVRLEALASALCELHEFHEEPEVLEEAIGFARWAVSADRPGHAERARRRNQLAMLLLARYDTDRSRSADLDQALAEATAAVHTCPPNHANRASLLGGLARIHLRRAQHRNRADDVHAALAALDRGRRLVSSLPSDRAACARLWAAATLQCVGDPAAAAAGAEYAFDLLESYDWHGLELTDRLHQLRGWSSFTPFAAACALELDDPARALTLLERGRGLVLWQLTGGAADLLRLAEDSPELAARFRTLREAALRLALESRPESDAEGVSRGSALARLNAEHRRLEAEIRTLDGFDSFLLPPAPESWAARPAGRDAVAVLNVAPQRTDAILVTGGSTVVVRLPVTADEVEAQVRRWTGAVEAAAAARAELPAGRRASRAAWIQLRTAEDEQEEILAWGWDVLTGPVLETLRMMGRSTGEPRVRWCPTGPLAAFPVAATGHHDGSGRSVLDRVCSSEAPTLRSLRDHVAELPAPGAPMLLAGVAAPYDGESELPGVAEEVSAVREAVSGSVTVLTGPGATRERLLHLLARHPRFHFAGHGTDPALGCPEASLSAADRPVTLADLVRATGGGELAYLSTCHGASTDAGHPDEALHLAAALRSTGFRHVVAVRRQLDDHVAAEAAGHFYRHLDDTGDPARALHLTLRRLRTDLAARSESGLPVNRWDWTGFTHLG